MLTTSTDFIAGEELRSLGSDLVGRPPGGFVLVEVIIVAVIVAILSAVAIPVYTGMIKSQRKEVAKNICQSTAVSANIYYRRYGTGPICDETSACVAKLGIFLPDADKYSLTISEDQVTVLDRSLEEADAVSIGYK